MSQGITIATLIAAGLHPTQATQFADGMRFACDKFAINTPARVAGFIGQARVESANFTQLEENLFYSSADRIHEVYPREVPSLQLAATLVRNPRALALAVYSGRLGNGAPASGDGWAFRGRGIFQITGRDSYADAATNLAMPYLEKPELVALPAHACLTAAWYWSMHRCNDLADAGLWDSITRQVNGRAMQAAAERSQYSQDAITAFA